MKNELNTPRLFERLLAGVVIMLLAGAAAWYLPFFYFTSLESVSLLVVLPALVAGLIPVFLGITGGLLLIGIMTLKRIFPGTAPRRLTIKIFYPLVILLGKILGISRDRIGQSFVEVNNRLVRSRPLQVQPEKLLLLMPHCLQDSECQVRITGRVANCQRCGRCDIKKLVELAESMGSRLAVATGGTLARRIISEQDPQGIVAVACERDLISGIQDSYPLPVLGILNQRPHGPCRDTTVNLDKVKEAVSYFLGRGT